MRILLLLFSLMACIGSTALHAQHHHEHSPSQAPPATPAPPLQWLLPNSPVWPHYNLRNPAQNATPKPVPLPEEKRFSWWGFRHKELHDRGVIQELLDKTKGKNCCDGVHSGECRVTKLVQEGGALLVMIDDLLCPVSSDTRFAPLTSFTELEHVVVCAGKTDYGGSGKRVCPKTYCIGTVGGT